MEIKDTMRREPYEENYNSLVELEKLTPTEAYWKGIAEEREREIQRLYEFARNLAWNLSTTQPRALVSGTKVEYKTGVQPEDIDIPITLFGLTASIGFAIIGNEIGTIISLAVGVAGLGSIITRRVGKKGKTQ